MRATTILELQLRPTETMQVSETAIPSWHPNFKVHVRVTDSVTGKVADACGKSILKAREEALRKLRGTP